MWKKYIIPIAQLQQVLDKLPKDCEFHYVETQFYNIPDTTKVVVGIRQTYIWEPTKKYPECFTYWFNNNTTKTLEISFKEVFIQKGDVIINCTDVSNPSTVDNILKLYGAKYTFLIKVSIISFQLGSGDYFLSHLENTDTYYLEGEDIENAPLLQEFADELQLTNTEQDSFYNLVAQSRSSQGNIGGAPYEIMTAPIGL